MPTLTSLASGVLAAAMLPLGAASPDVTAIQLADAQLVAGGGGVSAMPVDDKMIMPWPQPSYDFDFVYDGDVPGVAAAQTVLRRQVGSTDFARTILGSLDFPFVLEQAFDDLQVENLSLVENKEYGLSLSYSSYDGSVNVYKNWNKWPNPYDACNASPDPTCYERLKLTEKDVLTDAEMTRITDAFLTRLGISASDYGKPEVDQTWRTNQTPGAELWIPDEVQVIYPLRVGNQSVYEQYGGKSGLRVSVDLRQKRASSAGPFQPQSFTEVKYAGVAESELRDMIRSGGTMGRPLPIGETSTRPQVRLAAPERILVQTYYWDDAKRENQNLLIPALRFPVTSVPDGYELRGAKEITIPLVRGFQIGQQMPIYRIQDEASNATDAPNGNGGIVPPMTKPMMIEPARG